MEIPAFRVLSSRQGDMLVLRQAGWGPTLLIGEYHCVCPHSGESLSVPIPEQIQGLELQATLTAIVGQTLRAETNRKQEVRRLV